MTIEVELLTRSGDYVTTVQVMDLALPPEVVTWGQRIFVRNEAGEYREGLMVMAQHVVLPSNMPLLRKVEDGF